MSNNWRGTDNLPATGPEEALNPANTAGGAPAAGPPRTVVIDLGRHRDGLTVLGMVLWSGDGF